MSFLGYIGKTLGAGTAPIYNANLASQSDIQYREFRDNAPNRAREESLRMAGLERTEAEAQADEAETKRVRDLNAASARREVRMPGGVAGLPMPPGQASDAPIDIPPVPDSAPPARVGINKTGAVVPPAVTAPAVVPPVKGDDTLSAINEAVRLRGGREKLVQDRINQLQMDLTQLNTAVGSTGGSPARGTENRALQAERKAKNEELAALREEQKNSLSSPVTQPAPATARAAAAAPPAVVAATPAATPATPTAAAAAAATPTAAAAQPTSTPAPASYPQSVADIDPVRDFEAYTNPNRRSYDIVVVENELDRLEQYRQDIYAYADRTDRASMTAAFLNAKAIEDQMIMLDGTLSKLEVVQGVINAMGGKPQQLNVALSAALGVDVAINPYRAKDGTIVFQPTINGRLQEGSDKYLTGEEMRLYSMRMIDVELDKELTLKGMESKAALTEMYYEAQLKGELINQQLSADLQKQLQNHLVKFETDKALKLIERETNKTMKEITTLPNNTVVAIAEDGTIYRISSATRGKGNRKEDYTVIEEVPRK